MKADNYFSMTIPALSCNESFARSAVSAFAVQPDPTVDKLGDIRAAVSEAVTNCIVHAYRGYDKTGEITVSARLSDGMLYIKVRDKGCGIEDIEKAMQPLFTTAPEQERTGLGFAVMQSLCDKVRVRSKRGKGTTVTLIFDIGAR